MQASYNLIINYVSSVLAMHIFDIIPKHRGPINTVLDIHIMSDVGST